MLTVESRVETRLSVFFCCLSPGFVRSIDKSQYNKAPTKPLVLKMFPWTLLNIYNLNKNMCWQKQFNK